MKFTQLGIDENVVRILSELGITEPTPIQEKTIPEILKGGDLIGKAQTGTGKTLAFLLPAIEQTNLSEPVIQTLIVAPTRELALQITAELNKLSTAIPDFQTLAVYGGQDVERQLHKLKGSIHAVVATPGRLLDHIRRESIDLSRVKHLVLDEADQMLHIGFLPEVEEIMEHLPRERQTLLFSATMPEAVRALSAKFMKNPLTVTVESSQITVEKIRQLVIETTDRAKLAALIKTVGEQQPFLAIIFCRTKRRVSKLADSLKQEHWNVDELHGDLSQAKRERVMKSFREAKIQFLVATDVAARGLDVEGVTHIYNYDVPEDTESYIHRIGRTGRAGEHGLAVTFIAAKDEEQWKQIEKGIHLKIERRKMEGLQIKQSEKAPAPKKKRTGNNARADYNKRHGLAAKPKRSGSKDSQEPGRRGRNDSEQTPNSRPKGRRSTGGRRGGR